MSRAVDEGPPVLVAVAVVQGLGELGSFVLEFMLFVPVWLLAGWAYDPVRAAVAARLRAKELRP